MRWVCLILLAGLAGSCTPEIGSGAYFCGPERFCPPDQECDDKSFTCVNPLLAEPFSCPPGSESAEPDDVLAAARDLGVLDLNQPTVLGSHIGCLPNRDDVDLFRTECDTGCADGAGTLEVTLRYPIAFVPGAVDLLDGAGEVVSAGELCTPAVDYTGMDYVCINVVPELGVHYIRVAAVDGAPDCGGDCAYNRYSLDIKFMR